MAGEPLEIPLSPDYRALYRRLGRAGFLAAHPGPFLIWKEPHEGRTTVLASSSPTDPHAAAKTSGQVLDERSARAWFGAELQKRTGTTPLEGISLGRTPDRDVILLFPRISKLHAVIGLEHGQPRWLADQGSTYGTFVNRVRAPMGENLPIAVGDNLRLGSLDCLLVTSATVCDILGAAG